MSAKSKRKKPKKDKTKRDRMPSFNEIKDLLETDLASYALFSKQAKEEYPDCPAAKWDSYLFGIYCSAIRQSLGMMQSYKISPKEDLKSIFVISQLYWYGYLKKMLSHALDGIPKEFFDEVEKCSECSENHNDCKKQTTAETKS